MVTSVLIQQFCMSAYNSDVNALLPLLLLFLLPHCNVKGSMVNMDL